jgi:hypothetical protein
MIITSQNYLVHATAFNGKVRALAVNSTAAVRELARLQSTGPPRLRPSAASPPARSSWAPR